MTEILSVAGLFFLRVGLPLVALIVLGLGLMVAEAMSPSFGILGLGGIISFVFGSIILIDTDVPAFQIALPLIFALASVSVLCLIVVLGMLMRLRKHEVVSGIQTFLGQRVVVESLFHNEPRVRVGGDLWQVKCDSPLSINDQVEIVAAQGMVLEVKKIS